MNLIIAASLSEPPTEGLSFRYVTLVAHHKLNFDCLIEVENQMKDLYYYFLLKRGLLDFIEQLITPTENERGIFIDSEPKHPRTILTKSITCENYINLLNKIGYRE